MSNLTTTRIAAFEAAVTDEKIVERAVCDHVEMLLDRIRPLPAVKAIARVLQLTGVIAALDKRGRS